MKQNLGERIKNALAEIPEDRALFYMIGGMAVTLPLFIVGSAYAFAYIIEKIPKVVESVSNNLFVEYVKNNPYESLLAVAGITALGIGAHKYIERKMHVAETMEDFVEKAKAGKKPVEVQFQFGQALLGSPEKSIMLRAGKVRYGCNYTDLDNIWLPPLQNYSVQVGYAREIATNCLQNIESVIHLAEHLENKGLEVRISGGTIVNGPTSIDGAKEYLAACKGWVKSGNAFIIG